MASNLHMPRTIRARLLATWVLLGVGAVGLVIFLTGSRLEGALQAQQDRRAELLVDAISGAAATQPTVEGIQLYLEDLGGHDAADLIMVIAGEDPAVVACTDLRWIGSPVHTLPAELEADHALQIMRSPGGQVHAEPEANRTRRCYAVPVKIAALGGTRDLPDSASRGALMVHLSGEAIDAEVARGSWTLAAVLCLVTAIAFLLLWHFLHRTLLAPLSSITDSVRRRAQGDREAYAPVARDDEVGDLARTLNGMIDALDHSRAWARSNELRFQQLADTIADVFWIVDIGPPLTAVYISPAGEKVFERERGQLYANFASLIESIHEEDRGRYRAHWQELPNAAREITYRMVRSDGSLCWIEERSYPVRDESGRVTRVTGISADVTERRRAEEERQRLAALVEHGLGMMGLFSLDGQAFYINPAGREMLGVGREERLESLALSDLVGRSFRPALQAEIWPAVRLSGSWSGESALRNQRTGIEIPVLQSMFMIGSSETGRPTCVAVVGHDISAIKRANEELARTRDEALAAARAKSEFLATMSHEIRTPMNGVIGMTGLLIDSPLGSEQRDWVEVIRTSGNALLTLINDILDFSKLEAGRVHLEQLDFDLRVTVEEVLDLLAERAQGKGLEIAATFDDRLPESVQGDPARLRQILTNLVANAVKFTDEGHVLVKTSVVADAGDTAKVRVEVADSGIGIPVEAQDRLFQSFSQVDGSTTRKYGGTGLGLAISRELIELMDGTIGCHSEPGHGSTFWFEVALRKNVSLASDHVLGLPPDAARRILLATPSAIERDVVTQLVRRMGVECTCSATAAETRAALKQPGGSPFDLVLLDQRLEGMDKFALLSSLRQVSPDPAPRFVLLTFAARRKQANEARAAGFSTCLYFPVRQAALNEVLIHEQELPRTSSLPKIVLVGPRTAPAHRPRRVLVVEDNAVNQKVAVRMLERLEARADVVGNGLEALEALERFEYDLVLMDCQMPEMDGYEATRHIRRREGAARHTPIVAMTANAMEGDRERCLDCGMDDYLSKPINSALLREAVERWARRDEAA
ncbi:MAG: response regulator [Candidatus Eisenbacteria bacterium]|nr:response regulator [Candidatus Eisenbacteria bacterium]